MRRVKQQIATGVRQVAVIECSPEDRSELLPRVLELLGELVSRDGRIELFDQWRSRPSRLTMFGEVAEPKLSLDLPLRRFFATSWSSLGS